jgi:hypothetical protein
MWSLNRLSIRLRPRQAEVAEALANLGGAEWTFIRIRL